MKREDGFTLIELLIVVLIISILAAIAVPIFIKQRERGYEAQIKSALKNAATATESYGSANGGDYSALDGDDGTALRLEGYKAAVGVTIVVAAPAPGNAYCFTATHARLPVAHSWRVATYNSADGSPGPADADAC